MSSSALFVTFLVTTGLFALIPGPAMVYAAAQTMARGRRSGLMAALGIHLGGYIHVAAAAGGLSVLFHAVPLLYAAARLAGAAYLVWLGISLFRTTAERRELPLPTEPATGRRALLESVTVEALNPKTALFFLAFLPQFIDAATPMPVWVQFVLLGTMVNLVFSGADVLCVVFAGLLIDRLRQSSGARRATQRAGGAMIVGLGLLLAFGKG